VNSLWSDWQLGVRDFILIPVSLADEHVSPTPAGSLNNGAAAGVTTSCELVTRQELTAGNKLPKSSSAGHIADDTTPQLMSNTKQANSVSMEDYFSKYDLSLERIKENVHRIEQTMK